MTDARGGSGTDATPIQTGSETAFAVAEVGLGFASGWADAVSAGWFHGLAGPGAEGFDTIWIENRAVEVQGRVAMIAPSGLSAVFGAAPGGGALDVRLEDGGETDIDSAPEVVELQGRAAEYFVARQPDGTIAALRFVPVSLAQPDGMEHRRIAGSEFLQFADRLVRATDIPEESAAGDALPDAAAGPGAALTDVTPLAGAEAAENVISFNTAAAELVRLRFPMTQAEAGGESEMQLDQGANLNAVPTFATAMTATIGGAGDGGAKRFSLAVTPVAAAPVMDGAGAPVTYVKSAAALLIAPDLTLAGRAGATLAAARVEIGAALPEDRLVLANWRPEYGQSTTMGNVTLHYTNGVLLLTGMAALAEYEGLLRMVGYARAEDAPVAAPRDITVTVDDGSGQPAVVRVVSVAPDATAASGWVAQVAAVAAGDGVELAAPGPVVAAVPRADLEVGDASGTAGDAVVAAGDSVVRVGSAEADALSTEGADRVLALAGDDRITLAADHADLIVDGGEGLDQLVIGDGVAAYGPVADAALVGVEEVVIEAADGVALDLSRQSEGFGVTGGVGADTITGGQGADDVFGGAGDDLFQGFDEDGMDVWIGGDGTDTISFDGVAAAVTIDLSAGIATGATIGTDRLAMIENAMGGSAADVLTGDAGANRLEGGAGDDSIDGGAGNDRIVGGEGFDVLTGGDGDDHFCFSGPGGGADIITDFRPGDRVEITASEFLFGLSNEQVANGSWFFRGLAAQDMDDRLIYDRDSGYLVYDSNGSDEGGSVAQIARFASDEDLSSGSGGRDLDWSDFFLR